MGAQPANTAAADGPDAQRGLFAVHGARDEDVRRSCSVVMMMSTLLMAFLLLSIATSRGHVSSLSVAAVYLGVPVSAAAFTLARQGRQRPAATVLTSYLVAGVMYICLTDGQHSQRFGLMSLAVLAAGSVVPGWLTLLIAAGFVGLAAAIDTVPAVQALARPGWFDQSAHIPFLRQSALCGFVVFFLRRGYDQLYAEVCRQDAGRKAALEETRRLNESLERMASERTQHLSTTRDRVASISNDVAVDLQGDIDRIRDMLAEVRARTRVTDPERLADLTKATLAAARLDEMVANLVEHARLGRVALALQPLDMNALARQVIEQARASPEGARVNFILHPLPGASGDPVLVRSVLENLVANAVKFSARHPSPAVTIGHATAQDHHHLHYYVEDNGAGFDPHYADRLFSPFQRLHSRADFEGQGIGLANVRSIVERHGGAVAASGHVDGGARFTFSLPEAS
jgi:signal transduction histidine kinase